MVFLRHDEDVPSLSPSIYHLYQHFLLWYLACTFVVSWSGLLSAVRKSYRCHGIYRLPDIMVIDVDTPMVTSRLLSSARNSKEVAMVPLQILVSEILLHFICFSQKLVGRAQPRLLHESMTCVLGEVKERFASKVCLPKIVFISV